MMVRIQAKADEWLKIEPIARDARAVSPWLLANKWHLYIGRLDKPKLIQLVLHPSPDSVLHPLTCAVKEYFAHCETFLASTDVLVLQYLNSPNPSER